MTSLNCRQWRGAAGARVPVHFYWALKVLLQQKIITRRRQVTQLWQSLVFPTLTWIVGGDFHVLQGHLVFGPEEMFTVQLGGIPVSLGWLLVTQPNGLDSRSLECEGYLPQMTPG